MASVVDGQGREEQVGTDPAADLSQVVPAPARKVLDTGGDLEPSAVQVEVHDNGRPGCRQTSAHREGEGARPQPPGGSHDKDAWSVHHGDSVAVGLPAGRRRPEAGDEGTLSARLWSKGRANTVLTRCPLGLGAGSRGRRAPDMGRPRSGGQPGPSASRAPGGRSRSAVRSTPKGSE